jgi:hypothetical protein
VATVTSEMAQVSLAQGALALTQVALASAQVTPASAQVAMAMAQVGMATAEMAMATVHLAQNPLQQMSPPSSQGTELPQIPSALALAQWIQRTADDLAQEEAISTQTVGKRPRNKKVKFAGQ